MTCQWIPRFARALRARGRKLVGHARRRIPGDRLVPERAPGHHQALFRLDLQTLSVDNLEVAIGHVGIRRPLLQIAFEPSSVDILLVKSPSTSPFQTLPTGA